MFGGGLSWITIVHMLMGIGLGYAASAQLLNTTRIEIDSRTLKVRHFPLPWFPAPTLDVNEIEQIYVTEKYRSNKQGNRTYYYNVNAVMHDNKKRKILTNLPEVEQGLYIEQELEKAMNIGDRPVAGEFASNTVRT